MTSSIHRVGDAAQEGRGEGGVALVISLLSQDWLGVAVMSHISKLLSGALNGEAERDGEKVASF